MQIADRPATKQMPTVTKPPGGRTTAPARTATTKCVAVKRRPQEDRKLPPAKKTIAMIDLLQPNLITPSAVRAVVPADPRPTIGAKVKPLQAKERPKGKPITSSKALHKQWIRDAKPSTRDTTKHAALISYNEQYRGITSSKEDPMKGKTAGLDGYSQLYASLWDTVIRPTRPTPHWKGDVPTRSELQRRGRFGRSDLNHSVTQEAAFETCIFPILVSGFLGYYDFTALCNTHVLIPHLVKMIVTCHNYDFTWIAHEDPNWRKQDGVPQSHAMAMLAALFHYRMHGPDIMRFLGGTYTGEYRDIPAIVDRLTSHNIDPWLIAQYVRATTVGCPNHMVADISRDNALLHWRKGNHPSVVKYLAEVLNTVAKEHRNRYNGPLPNYIARFLPHCFITPQHALKKPDKALRLIFDASKRYTAQSTPINMMTSTKQGSELDCLYGDVFQSLLERIWDLRTTYPDTEIVIHANDVKSCFKQVKLHPDVMPAFSIMVTDFLYLQTALPFGTDFSPQNWEPMRRLVEVLSEKLFKDTSLRAKHRKYLDRLKWDATIGTANTPFVPAKSCTQRTGVLDKAGHPVPTPQRLFVDDSVYAEIWERTRIRIEQTIAAGIESIFILLGHSDLDKRQDPISFDKMEEMIISYMNKVLGQIIDTRKLDVGVPSEYIAKVLRAMKPFHSERKSFTIKEMETITGMLIFIAGSAPWLKFMLSQLYTSIAAALGDNTAHLRRTNKQFRQFIKEVKAPTSSARVRSFAQSATARETHACRKTHWLNKTLKEELHLIMQALSSKHLRARIPIAHLVRRDPSAEAWSDSSLLAAGGYSISMQFWWYLEWPPEVKKYTLVYVKNNKDGSLISINVLEYAALLINYAATYHFYKLHPDASDPYPLVLLRGDNTASESWIDKACNSSLIGRALSRLQCAMMMNNPVGIYSGHISTKDNIIADLISRIECESHSNREFLKISQDYPELDGCKRFQPSAELISHIMDAISQKKLLDPLVVNASILTSPGRITS